MQPQTLQPLRHGGHARMLRELVGAEIVEPGLAARRAVHDTDRPNLAQAVLTRQRKAPRLLNERLVAQVLRRR